MRHRQAKRYNDFCISYLKHGKDKHKVKQELNMTEWAVRHHITRFNKSFDFPVDKQVIDTKKIKDTKEDANDYYNNLLKAKVLDKIKNARSNGITRTVLYLSIQQPGRLFSSKLLDKILYELHQDGEILINKSKSSKGRLATIYFSSEFSNLIPIEYKTEKQKRTNLYIFAKTYKHYNGNLDKVQNHLNLSNSSLATYKNKLLNGDLRKTIPYEMFVDTYKKFNGDENKIMKLLNLSKQTFKNHFIKMKNDKNLVDLKQEMPKFVPDSQKIVLNNLVRKYNLTIAELIDRLSIIMLKKVFISENADNYEQEIELIKRDISSELSLKNMIDINVTNALVDIMVTSMYIILCNRVIWENESHVRKGENQDFSKLRFTHSLNGVRNELKNFISNSLGERIDLKIDCLADDMDEVGNWNKVLFDLKNNKNEN